MNETYIGIKFSEKDREMMEAINKSFPDCTTVRSDELEGAEVFLTVIIPLAGFALQLWDFILNHIVPKKKEEDNPNDLGYAAARMLVAEGKEISGAKFSEMDELQVEKTISVILNINLETGEVS